MYKIGYISGMFDILHIGHIDILRRSKELCEHLIVAVGTDDYMRQKKNREPVIQYNERVEIVKTVRYVNQVVPALNIDKISAYNRYKFDVMFLGEDHKNETIYMYYIAELDKLNVNTIFIPRKYDISSTTIRNSIVKKFA
ncbi:MAG: adenylyltransferase/cytidyltransferase family protein [Lachnospiraceae bacterium]|jgi:glycerol-3-phosphate cytidylyltransferase|nr:adenylyltransferase/cytidyltransferase family protein [Lachnospiraceae bacterium]